MHIRESQGYDRSAIEMIHTRAFGKEKGPEIADLVNGLFDDETARPMLSLLALRGDDPVGHILFTRAEVAGTGVRVSVRLLAPLAVLPEAQDTGVGGLLIKEGLDRLEQAGVDLVFVLGHPGYYPRSGFTPAGRLGFEAPYPIPEEHAGAWMVTELSSGAIGRVRGRVACSRVLDQPRHWRE